MEADTYLLVSEALAGRSRTIDLPVRQTAGIDKLVWSSWDFMIGPELRFVWELVPGVSTPLNFSAPVSRDESNTSSGPKFEDIDDDFGGQLLTAAAEVHVCARCLRSGCDGGRACDDFAAIASSPLANLYISPGNNMTESQSTIGASGTTSSASDDVTATDSHEEDGLKALRLSFNTFNNANDVDEQHEEDQNELYDQSNDFYEQSQDRENGNPPAENGAGLRQPLGQLSKESSDGSCVTVLTGSSSAFTAVSGGSSARSSDVDDNASSTIDMAGSSAVESGTTPTMLAESVGSESSRRSVSTDETPVANTDEQYAAMHVLSGEICRSHLPDGAVEHKLIILNERQLLIGSYAFAAKPANGHRSVHSVSLLMHDNKLKWYMERLSLLQQIFADIAARLKAAILIENEEELACRMTTEWSQLIELIGSLERAPLCSRSLPPKIQDTYLSLPNSQQNQFLAKSISAALQSKGQVVVVGGDDKLVRKMMLTLSFFLPDEERWCCLRPFCGSFSPYLKLQAVRKDHLSSVMALGTHSAWPIALVDVDKQSVQISAPYWDHRRIKLEAQRQDVKRVIGIGMKKPVQLDFRSVSVESTVKDFLLRVDVLPYDNAIRAGFVQQFMRLQAQRALALIVVVQEQT
uniref:Folliculin n=1 Tax=Plectus sambesii TaxID=2011161 RepID=A0A914WKG1_9BILA